MSFCGQKGEWEKVFPWGMGVNPSLAEEITDPVDQGHHLVCAGQHISPDIPS